MATGDKLVRQYILFLFLLVTASCGFPQPDSRAEAEAFAQDRTIRQRCIGTPAEFAANQRDSLKPQIDFLLSSGEEFSRKTIQTLAATQQDIQNGLAWQEPCRKIIIPRLSQVPVLDGAVKTEEWHGAYVFSGEYPLNQTIPRPGEATVWRIGHDGKYLWCAASFDDSQIISRNGTFQTGGEKFYHGDCLELFIRPDNNSRIYYEFLMNPEGMHWAILNANNMHGSWVWLDKNLNFDLQSAAGKTPHAWSVELKISLEQLIRLSEGRALRSGDDFSLMMVRIDKNDREYRKATPVPLLYEGHNIFGYVQTRLE